MADPSRFNQIAKLILDALRIWRQPLAAKSAAFVVYVGLGLLTPGLRDLLLVGLPALINWIFERFGLSLRLPPLESAPWWTGLILVGAGLLFLYLQAREGPVVITVKVSGDEVTITIKGPAEIVDKPGLQQVCQQALTRRATQAPPPAPPLNQGPK